MASRQPQLMAWDLHIDSTVNDSSLERGSTVDDFSALMLLVRCQEEHPARKNQSNEVSPCWRGYLLE